MKISLKKGLNLELAGGIATPGAPEPVKVARYAIVPDDFPGLVPKLEVKEGDRVVAGQALLRDKNREQVKLTAPAGGTVSSIVRGERRKIMRVVVDIDSKPGEPVALGPAPSTPDQALGLLCRSGLLACMRQRPYDIVPDPEVKPRDIFITAIDSAPLSPGLAFRVAGRKADLVAGVKVLALLTSGRIYLSVGSDWELGDIAGATMVAVSGKHPAGNVGVQIANIAPVNKGDTVWEIGRAHV